MARKPSYERLSIVGQVTHADEPTDPAEAPSPMPIESHLITDLAHHTMVYHSPAAHKALAQLALELSSHKAKVKVHDLWVEAMQAFCDQRGLNVTVRVMPKVKVG